MGANARGHIYIAVSAALVVLSTVIVGIRIAARGFKANLGWDDYAICLSIVLTYSILGQAIFCIVLDHSGASITINLNARYALTPTQCFFTNEISYTLLIPTIKVSILILYRRIFSVPKFQRTSLLAGGLNQPGIYINAKSFFGNAISNLLIDVIILTLLIPMVLQLQLRLSQKLTILGIFLLGEDSVCVASIMRVVTLDIFNKDTSYAFSRIRPPPGPLWSLASVLSALVCQLCVLCCEPYAVRFRTGDSKDAYVGKNYGMQRISRSGKTNDEAWGYDRFDDEYALTAGSSKLKVRVDDTL
ncbi:hypothetical protein N7501_007474 [Penicillium viridicatum]|nr:hypothetical protein N7501_007474 [Penicillium viridicatum]